MKLGAILGQMEDYLDTEQEHRAIVDALKANDWNRAYETLVHHLDRGEQEALELV